MRMAKFDKAAVGELQLNLLGGHTQLTVKFKLVDTTSGRSYASATISSAWSTEILDKLKELTALLEQDAEQRLFTETATGPLPSAPSTGIGELFDEEGFAST